MGGRKTIELPSWVNKNDPDEVKAFRSGVRAGRSGKPMPENGRFFVIVYNGWLAGKKLREESGKGKAE